MIISILIQIGFESSLNTFYDIVLLARENLNDPNLREKKKQEIQDCLILVVLNMNAVFMKTNQLQYLLCFSGHVTGEHVKAQTGAAVSTDDLLPRWTSRRS